MSQARLQELTMEDAKRFVGVGLRHPHYQAALSEASPIGFIEIHAENFFAQGGPLLVLLERLIEAYPISLHSTSLGLGSALGIDENYLRKLALLNERVQPVLMSDHACFSWGAIQKIKVHGSDLLPIEFTQESLQVMTDNVDRVQQILGRSILVENLSSYLDIHQIYPPNSEWMAETEFLDRLVDNTGCGLLIDLNNLLVNGFNFISSDPLSYAKKWFDALPHQSIKEIHLAGFTPVAAGKMIVDDHSQAVSDLCWKLYQYAVSITGPVPTLIEWDNNLPDWGALVNEALKAADIMGQGFHQQTGYGR